MGQIIGFIGRRGHPGLGNIYQIIPKSQIEHANACPRTWDHEKSRYHKKIFKWYIFQMAMVTDTNCCLAKSCDCIQVLANVVWPQLQVATKCMCAWVHILLNVCCKMLCAGSPGSLKKYMNADDQWWLMFDLVQQIFFINLLISQR